MNARRKLWRQVREGAATLAYGNLLYRYFLQGPVPARLQFLPQGFCGGDAAQGERLLQGQFVFHDEGFGGAAPPWQPERASLSWLEAMHGFAWLEDLRAHNTLQAQQAAAAYIADWLDLHDRWRPVSWAPQVLGMRLASWIGAAGFYLPVMEGDVQARLFASLSRQMRHLMRLLPGNLTGLSALMTYKGLIYTALNLPAEGASALGLALTLLVRRVREEVLPDGGHAARAPRLMFDYLRHLMDIREALAAARIAVPNEIEHAVAPMTAALRSLRHGDGGFALFHGGDAGQAAFIDQVLDRASNRIRAGRSMPHLGYERLQAGRCLLFCDTAMPPPRLHDRFAHGAPLAFEFSHGRERIIVNCGGHPAPGVWRQALAATAAHSTVTVADTNAAEILAQGGVGRRPKQVTARSYMLDGVHTVEASHEGYRENFGLTHERKLSLKADGSLLAGTDVLRGPGLYPYALRFHLHPKIACALAQNGQVALLRAPSGQGWRLEAGSHALTLEPGIYAGEGGKQKSQQIVIHAKSGADVPVVWTLARV